MENAAGAQVAVNAGDGHITLLVQRSKAKIDFDKYDGRLRCRVKLHTEGSIEGARFMEDYLYDAQIMKQLQNDFANRIREEIDEILYVFQQELGVDGFGLKELLRKKDWQLYEEYMHQAQDDWRAVFEDIDFAVDVDVLIRNSGAVK